MKRYDVITIGAATRDVFLQSRAIKIIRDASFSTGEAECFALGSKLEVEKIVFEIGGGATNAAVSFSRQGFRTAFAGKVGATDERGRIILTALKKEGVDVSIVSRDKKKLTAYSVLLLTNRGERTALVYRGASGDFRTSDFNWPKMKTKWLYISSLAGELSILKNIWRHAKRQGARIAWDPGAGELALGREKLMPFLRQTDILHINQEEAAKLMGLGFEQDEISFDHVRKMTNGVTLVTGGTEGALAGTATDSWRSATHPIQVVDTTGAGDAFTSGFTAMFIRTKGDIPRSLQFATANAESVIGHIGAQVGLLRGHQVVHPVRVVRR